jgi:hypothetical protein
LVLLLGSFEHNTNGIVYVPKGIKLTLEEAEKAQDDVDDKLPGAMGMKIDGVPPCL